MMSCETVVVRVAGAARDANEANLLTPPKAFTTISRSQRGHFLTNERSFSSRTPPCDPVAARCIHRSSPRSRGLAKPSSSIETPPRARVSEQFATARMSKMVRCSCPYSRAHRPGAPARAERPVRRTSDRGWSEAEEAVRSGAISVSPTVAALLVYASPLIFV